MRLLQGGSIVEAPAGWREAAITGGRVVVIDVGTGDGRWPYEQARHDSATLYVGLDPDAAALAAYAYRAGRKPARGGVANAVYVVAALATLPDELRGLASRLRVNFPWTGLLRAVLLPEREALLALATLLAPAGRLELVVTYDVGHDVAALAGETLPGLDETYIDSTLTPAYAAAGLIIEERRRLTLDEALAIPSSWGRRLLHGRPRDVFWIEAHRADDLYPTPLRGVEG